MSDTDEPTPASVSRDKGGNSSQAVSNARLETLPSSLRNVRACLLCSLVKTVDQFEADGCDNCEQVLMLKHDDQRVYTCTSSAFDGLISLMQPKDSWVAKWQNIQRKVPGVYAVSVSGTLPGNVQAELKTMGITYRTAQRDKTQR